MRVRLLAFASASEALGAAEIDLDLPDGSGVEDLRDRLASGHPSIGSLWNRLAIAVNGQIVNRRERLHDGDEVALLPPVSGGLIEADDPLAKHLVHRPIDVDALSHASLAPDCGAIVSFLGTVRAEFDGRPVAGIHYSAYSSMAEARLETIEAELRQAHEGLRLRIVHRLGELEVGEVSIAILAASPHRDAAYSACREALERVKREVPIWKRERYADGATAWREEHALGEAGSSPTGESA